MQEELKSYLDDLKADIAATEEVLAKDVMYDDIDLARLDTYFYNLATQLHDLRRVARQIQRGE